MEGEGGHTRQLGAGGGGIKQEEGHKVRVDERGDEGRGVIPGRVTKWLRPTTTPKKNL